MTLIGLQMWKSQRVCLRKMLSNRSMKVEIAKRRFLQVLDNVSYRNLFHSRNSHSITLKDLWLARKNRGKPTKHPRFL